MKSDEVRLRVQLSHNKKRSVWAQELSPSLYRVMKRNGDLTNEFIIVTPNDIISKKQARMSLKYAEFEVVKEE